MAQRYRIPVARLILAPLLLASCVDLDVQNLDAPDRERALNTFGDVWSLVSASFNTWFNAVYSYGGPGMFMSQVSYQHLSPWACSTEVYSRIPRVPFQNDPADVYFPMLERVWDGCYQAINAVADGFRSLEDPDVTGQVDRTDLDMLRAFGKLSVGIAHGTVALFYDRGVRMDETVDAEEERALMEYHLLMRDALAYLDEAIVLAEGAEFTLPYGWMQASVTAQDLARLAHSFKARFRAQEARNPLERARVDWAAVAADVDAGIQDDFTMEMDWDNGWYNSILDYSTWPSWHGLGYFIYGMADQSGDYQAWSRIPLYQKTHLLPDGSPVLITTPDLRFPRGATVEAQRENPGLYFRIVEEEEEGDTWKRPDRGSWRWSWYKAGALGGDYGVQAELLQPLIRIQEMRLLKAEANYRMGDLAGAAELVNQTRTRAGLAPTDADGSNPDCVPRLPDGSCGDLWEMLKWEKRMETVWTGVAGANWWFDGRGWGDLWEGSPLQIPVPCTELRMLREEPCYTFGGVGGDMASRVSTYEFLGEGGGPFSASGSLTASNPATGLLFPGCDGPVIDKTKR